MFRPPKESARVSPGRVSVPGITGKMWPVHPHRLPDELLSFWMLRLAHDNGLKLQTFTNLSFGRSASLWNRDIDRSASPEFIRVLSAYTGSSVDEIWGGTLGAYEGVIFERHNPLGNTSWILPLGVYHRTRRRFGMQFCPSCLFFDRVPYFRRRWRLGFATMCDEHGTLLHDRCPECDAPVIYFRNDLGRRMGANLHSHVTCWRCGYDLRRSSQRNAAWSDAQSYIALRSLLTFIDDGIAVAGDRCHDYAPLFLDVLRRVCLLLAGPGIRSRRLRECVTRSSGISLGPGMGRLELLPLEKRHRLVLAGIWLLLEWPDRFIDACEASGLSASRVVGEMPYVPYWFHQVVDGRLNKAPYVPSETEVRNVASYLAKRRGGVTRLAIRQTLGSDSQLIDRVRNVFK